MKMLIFIASFFLIATGSYLHAYEQQSDKRVVILLGPPGSGKGTQAVRLSKALAIPHISTGDLFRENLSKNTDLGKKAREYMDKGQLVPDEVVLDMLFARVAQPDCANGYLLDGFPRTIAQAEALDRHIGKNSLVALNLEVSDDAILKRMAGRLTCKGCGQIYNRFLAPSQVEGKCDKCGGELYQRTDDNLAVVEERLRVYHKQTKPLIEYYDKKKVLKTVNGEQAPDQVFSDLQRALELVRKFK